MANGNVEIHDPFSNQNGHAGSKDCDHKSTSDTDSMENTVEYRLLMAYAKRKRTTEESPTPDTPALVNSGTDANESSSPQTPDKTEKGETKKDRKRKRLKHLRSLFSCISSQKRDEEPYQMNLKPNDDVRGLVFKGATEEDELKEAASRLAKLADEIQFLPPEVEADSPEDDNVERIIGLLLRESGDRLNERELKDAAFAKDLFWNYSFFKLLISTLLERMGLKSLSPDSPGPKAATETQIAVTCEVTTRLSAVDTLPSNRLLNHGARYLQHYYSPWAQQQGGYEEAFYSDDEDDSEQN
ncbi:apoptosis facilitator Bcl-2-like protein 14 isoform X2 [Sebastes umbrosus]|uniref:apoptosis facilitator Bcl-2-like protein 14 isoform X2 n=1 Tax=Sebastes umbrosus TaxID=72105 RepID=UPI00189CADBF|nr:apoptosis facilitator Bcl-2-like protein 14 isoform X2 [Sebastes umbrosus]